MNYSPILTLGFFIFISLILISSLAYLIYKLISEPSLINQHKIAIIEIKKIFQLQKLESFKKNYFRLIFVVNIIIIFILSLSVSQILFFPGTSPKFNFLVYCFVLIVPMLFSGLYYNNIKRYYASRKYFSVLFSNILPLFLSILSILIQYSILYGNFKQNFTIEDLINFQRNNSIKINTIEIPAFFILLNPLAGFAYFVSLIGIFRMYKSNVFKNNLINRHITSKILRNLSMFMYVLLLMSIFIGGGLSNEIFPLGHSFVNIFFIIVIFFIVGIMEHGKPEMFGEKKVLNIPLICAFFSLIYSIILVFFI